jgi:hypothetical protein
MNSDLLADVASIDVMSAVLEFWPPTDSMQIRDGFCFLRSVNRSYLNIENLYVLACRLLSTRYASFMRHSLHSLASWFDLSHDIERYNLLSNSYNCVPRISAFCSILLTSTRHMSYLRLWTYLHNFTDDIPNCLFTIALYRYVLFQRSRIYIPFRPSESCRGRITVLENYLPSHLRLPGYGFAKVSRKQAALLCLIPSDLNAQCKQVNFLDSTLSVTLYSYHNTRIDTCRYRQYVRARRRSVLVEISLWCSVDTFRPSRTVCELFAIET